MTYRSRAYPYPVLAPWSEDFTTVTELGFQIDVKPIGQQITDGVRITVSVPKDVLEFMTSNTIDGDFEWILDVESPQTLFREILPFGSSGFTVEFLNGEIAGLTNVTPILVAKSDQDYAPKNLTLEFKRSNFKLQKGDPVIVGPTQVVDVEIDRQASRGFVKFIHMKDLGPDEYIITCDNPVLTVFTGMNVQLSVEVMKANADMKPHLFMSIYKDCLYFGARHIQLNPDAAELTWARGLTRKLDAEFPGWIHEDSETELHQKITSLVGTHGVRKILKGFRDGD